MTGATLDVPVTPPRARRRRLVPTLLLILAVLFGLAVVADRVVVAIAQNQVADLLVRRFSLSQRPTVEFRDFPFLTQLATGKISIAEVKTDQVQAVTPGGRAVEILQGQATMRGAQRGAQNQVVVDQLDGSVQVRWEQARNLINMGSIQPDGENRVQLTMQANVLGSQVQAVITGRIQLDEPTQTVFLAETRVSVNGAPLPQPVADSLVAATVPRKQVALPYGIRGTEISTNDLGVTLVVTGSNVDFGSP